MPVKKLSFCLEDADITLRSNLIPLRRFLEKNTLNSKVNNWVVEIEQCQFKFKYIKGIKNTLVNTMHMKIAINPNTCQDLEPEGQEYIYCCRSLVFSGTVHWFEGRQAFIHYCGLHQV